jgi:cardiolipin synthase A/B
MNLPSFNYRAVLEQTMGLPFFEQNHVEVLKNGDRIFPSMLQAIKDASEQIEFLTFVYWSGDIAYKFARALSEKAEQGVKVMVILDSLGAAKMPKNITEMMTQHGVQLEWFRPISSLSVGRATNRTHRKVLVCDQKVAFTGGVGIAREWEGDARNENEWRDTHFRIEGPAVAGLQAAFLENWLETGHYLDLSGTPHLYEPAADHTIAIQVVRTSASVRWSSMVMLYQTLLKMARYEVVIATAYFNPNRVMVNLLKETSLRGVDIRVMVPGKHTDKTVARLAGDDCFQELMNAGVEIFYYQKTMLHSKIITIDGQVSCVGSANFNHRSMLQDDEINVVILDQKITEELNHHFEEDLKASEPVDPSRWKKRGLIKRSMEKATGLFQRQI